MLRVRSGMAAEHDGNGEDKHDGKKLLERLGATET
jgi:hypothetical protein